MKKQILAAAAALCLMATTPLFAQEQPQRPVRPTPPTVEQMAQHRTQRMAERMQLNDDQIKKVYEVNLEQIKQMQQLREQMKAVRTSSAEQMKEILTTEQFMQWAQMQHKHPQRPAQHAQAPHRRHHKQAAMCCPQECPKACPCDAREE